MEDILIYMTIASSLLVIIFIISLLRPKPSAEKEENDEGPVRRAGVMGAPVRRVGGRVVRSRLQRQRVTQQERDDEEQNAMDIADENDSDEGGDPNQISLPTDAKIGTKKRKKLEMKAEKRLQREQEMEEREERKQRQARLDEEKKQQDEKERLEELKKKEEEQQLLEEKKRREHEEYLKLKESFQIESEGFDEDANETEGKDMLKEFIDYIINTKVVFLEDLAVSFKLKTQDVIERVNSLLESGDLTGVIDDRGKFIYISQDELNAVARFIKQRGRVSISELVESSNILINMNSAKST